MNLSRSNLTAVAKAVADDLLKSGALVVDAALVDRLQLSIAATLVDALEPPAAGLPVPRTVTPASLASQLSDSLSSEPVVRSVRVDKDALKRQISAVLSKLP